MNAQPSNYEPPVIEREVAPSDLAREGHYAGVVNSESEA
jgi:hypothetical protein